MAEVKLTLQVEIDGVPLRGFPLTRRKTVSDVQEFDFDLAAGASLADLPLSNLATRELVVLFPNEREVQVSMASSGVGLFKVLPEGLLVAWGINLSGAPMALNPDGTNAARLRGVGGGT